LLAKVGGSRFLSSKISRVMYPAAPEPSPSTFLS